MDSYKKLTVSSTSNLRLRPKIRVAEELSDATIRKAMQQWRSYTATYRTLYDYYIGRQIPELTEDETVRVMSNHCYYIVSAIKGYMTGNAPSYAYEDGDVYAEQIIEAWQANSMETTEAELIQALSTFGVAYELVYRKENGRIRSEVYDPMSAFVAYSGDIDADSVFGAIYYEMEDENGQPYYRLYAYTRTDLEIWESTSTDGPWRRISEPTPHGFGRVPLIEYSNNADRLGDFEQIISLQAQYNQLLKERLEDKNAFAKSILAITGQVIGKTPEEVEDALKILKRHRVLQFDDENGHGEYLEKTMDESGVQVLQDCLKRDIHKLAMVPDLSDESFANNASGVAMSYKLFGTDNKVSDKERYFREGFLRRCKLYDYAMNNTTLSPNYEPKASIHDMGIVFKLNAPQDLSYMATALTPLVSMGVLSKRTAMENLLIVANPDQEEERIAAEQEQQAQYNRATFESETFPGMTDESETDTAE